MLGKLLRTLMREERARTEFVPDSAAPRMRQVRSLRTINHAIPRSAELRRRQWTLQSNQLSS